MLLDNRVESQLERGLLEVEMLPEDIVPVHTTDPDRTYRCPVARALNRATGKRWRVGDNTAAIAGNPDEACSVWITSPETRRFIQRFDNGDRVTPITVVLTR